MRQCTLGVACAWGEKGVPKQVCPSCVEGALRSCREAEKVETEWRGEKEAAVARRLEKRRGLEAKRAQRMSLLHERERLARILHGKKLAQRKIHAQHDAAEAALHAAKLPTSPTASVASATSTTSIAKAKGLKRNAENLHWLRHERLKEVRSVFPLKTCEHTKHHGITVCEGLCVPIHVDVDTVQAFSETKLSAGIGVLCHVLKLLSETLAIHLPYEIEENGSLSSISVSCAPEGDKGVATLWEQIVGVVGAVGRPSAKSDALQHCVFPLFLTSVSDVKERSLFFKGLAILNLNIAALLRGMRVVLARPGSGGLPPIQNIIAEDTPHQITLIHDCLVAALDDPNLQMRVPVGYPHLRATPQSVLPVQMCGTLMAKEVEVFAIRVIAASSDGTISGKVKIAEPSALRAGGKQGADAASASAISGRMEAGGVVHLEFILPVSIARLVELNVLDEEKKRKKKAMPSDRSCRFLLSGTIRPDGIEACISGVWRVEVEGRGGGGAFPPPTRQGGVSEQGAGRSFVLRASPSSYTVVVPGAYLRYVRVKVGEISINLSIFLKWRH